MKNNIEEIFKDAKYKVGDRVKLVTCEDVLFVVENRLLVDLVANGKSDYLYVINTHVGIRYSIQKIVSEHEIFSKQA